MYFLNALSERISSALRGSYSLELMPSWEKGKHGHLSTNVAFEASKLLKANPLVIAQDIDKVLCQDFPDWIKVEIAPPGFLNLYLKPNGAWQILEDIFSSGEVYGAQDIGHLLPINFEYCSANPTGPIHLGNARGACIGHVLANFWERLGYKVCREYYFDDVGTQVTAFILSLEARYLEILGKPFNFPEDGYQGEYVKDIANRLYEQYSFSLLELPREEMLKRIAEFGLQMMRRQHENTLSRLGINFNVWFPQSSLKAEGWLDQALALLDKNGYLYSKEGAIWFRSTHLGDDKDRVVIRSNGEPTYFAWDIAYNLNKVQRGFKKIIDIWGPDHHGYVKRNLAAFQAMGFDPKDLILLIYQMVKLYEGGEEISMSKRTGEFVTLDEVIDIVGKDATIFFLINCSLDSNLEFDLDLAKMKSLSNPVYYIQYAYTRAFSIMKEAELRGRKFSSSKDLTTLYEDAELNLLAYLALMPEDLRRSALSFSPLRLANFARALAGAFHSYYHDYRVLGGGEKEEGRLVLVEAVRITLANILQLLGLERLEKM